MGRNKYIAHIRNRDKAEQSLEDHLKGVAYLARVYADKIGFGDFGELIGLIHDVGKYSESFQNYICSFVKPDKTSCIKINRHNISALFHCLFFIVSKEKCIFPGD